MNVDALIAFAASACDEGAHVMPFPREQGFDVAHDLQRGDVFVRATVAEVLADLTRRNIADCSALVARELAHLVDVRRSYWPGGWSYFPSLHELPADADDLAQVMHAFISAGAYDAVERFCNPALQVLLDECSTSPGIFETWIVPRRDDAVYQKQRWWIANAWGAGPDPEVIANLLRALVRLDEARYRDTIEGGRRFVLSCRRKDALWDASWYHGPFYATFACARLFEGHESIEATLDALALRQHGDGGWGLDGASDPLNTAFALMTFAGHEYRFEALVERARAFLQTQQRFDGSWDAVPWIRMELGRAQGEVRQVLSYGSRTISTAYAIKALYQTEATIE